MRVHVISVPAEECMINSLPQVDTHTHTHTYKQQERLAKYLILFEIKHYQENITGCNKYIYLSI